MYNPLEPFFLIIILLLFLILICCFVSAYNQNKTLKSILFVELYKKINNDPRFKELEVLLSNNAVLSSEVKTNLTLIENLEFMDSLVSVGAIGRFSKNELKTLFGNYPELLKRHQAIREYILENNYENLAKVLEIKTD